jgi:FAD/FMN-containing dehydrogenase
VNQHGRSLPVLPAYELLSVAGTLSVGGYGERSVRYGSQIHHVKRLKLVLANGRSLWCSPQENADLFRFSLAGLGQVGVIVQVVMDTIPYQPEIAPLVYHYPTADEFLSGLEWLNIHSHQVDRFAGYYIHGQGYFAEWWIRELGQTPAGQRVTEVPAFRTQESQDEGYRLAADYLFDLEGLASSLKWLENQWRNTTLEQYAAWALILAVKPGVSDTLFPFEAKSMKPGATGLHFLVGFYPVVEMEDEPGLAFIRQLFRQGLKLCVAENGRPYLYGFHELDEAAKEHLYGDNYQHLKQLRQQYDPQNLLNRGSL